MSVVAEFANASLADVTPGPLMGTEAGLSSDAAPVLCTPAATIACPEGWAILVAVADAVWNVTQEITQG
ncbi:linaridin family RiPP [Streptomyces hoynatensis]|uniref:Linaridin family RiPP n=1 Tax=Streptomyces hoynatensis TaxID=1141874 RepID=A0A3A9YFZ8_9ACTN|nr:linaridin family RiPP [Streptomyces hoynatensis]RKN35813.1 linaridin family RiPP [Streptomyces hoynatensis]